ncbi:potassium channel protein [Halobacillus sp. ACCC02827]|uniref:potassium channel family protein n=1 Tax=Bacillaceae TaxID=186817 RepID=UPI0002A51811|nr:MULTISPECIES: potassium channel protein [Bacillaceae]ELK45946.1 potassium channel protein [Halobacillus sp. BAB-2008]QHT47497.1 potassium channel protein [Bacillus sp. SB49]WJE14727.1 potassium channel protein [Halobacillus sp. ACCC02827]
MQHWVRLYFQLPLFLRLLATVFFTMTLFGFVIHMIEPANFPTVFDGIWWAFVTGATVGYGDYVPLSPYGKLMAILLILSGGGLVTFYMATLSASTVKHETDLSEGKVPYKGAKHLVLIGWNERTRHLIDMIQKHQQPEEVVLIDRTMNTFYQRLPSVHFISGSATNEETLEKANLLHAKLAIITADPSLSEEQSDQSVIHQIVAAKGHHPGLFIIAEVLTDKQKINAERAGADTVIRSNDFMSSLFYQELYRNDPAKPFELLLGLLAERQFHEEAVPKSLIGNPVTEAFQYYMKDCYQVIAVRRREDVLFHIHPDLTLQEGDVLVVFSPLRK